MDKNNIDKKKLLDFLETNIKTLESHVDPAAPLEYKRDVLIKISYIKTLIRIIESGLFDHE